MKERPILDLLESISNQKGVQIEFLEKKGHFPFAVHSQGFQGGKLELNSKVSSQFVTSVLLSAPYAVEPVTLILKDVKESDEVNFNSNDTINYDRARLSLCLTFK